jgi:hypothetical protein
MLRTLLAGSKIEIKGFGEDCARGYKFRGELAIGNLISGAATNTSDWRGPNGIRTRVSALRGPCPGPLDDGAGQTRGEWLGEEGSNPHYRGQNPASYH